MQKDTQKSNSKYKNDLIVITRGEKYILDVIINKLKSRKLTEHVILAVGTIKNELQKEKENIGKMKKASVN